MKRLPSRRGTKADPLEKEIEAALQPGDFISYGACWSFVEDLEHVEARLAAPGSGRSGRASWARFALSTIAKPASCPASRSW